MTWQTLSKSTDTTGQIGVHLGNNLRGGEVIELVSDLGGGKTTFVRGLARGFGSSDKVASPSFTISKVYKSGESELHHFDFYRLHEAGIVARELDELVGDEHVTIVVEWADLVRDVLPTSRLTIKFKTIDEDTRLLEFVCPKPLEYLMENLK